MAEFETVGKLRVVRVESEDNLWDALADALTMYENQYTGITIVHDPDDFKYTLTVVLKGNL